MNFQLKLILIFAFPWFIACGQLGLLTNSGASGMRPTQDVSTLDVSAKSGAEIAIVNADSGINGTEVSILLGALAIDTQVTVEIGSMLVDNEVANSLDLGEDNSISEVGPSVLVLPEELTNPNQPL